ncbi:hypothetical protein [Thermincola potens]|uniref:Uncharacterized protein n=1 Tax=Thermincola potens (strain JR) TaxID=635013 RepID=D5XF93_THEPJ|nr:hypothetical protein [Thermincola potens]ADG82314.1 hypothetical protein TherJR_1458 [Thermincola potens JR]
MNDQQFAKKILKLGLLLILLAALYFQLFWEVIILSGDIPAAVTISELLVFTCYSLILLIFLLVCIGFLAGQPTRIIFVIFGSVLIYFWSISVVDTIEYGRNNYLLYNRVVGLMTATLPICFSLWVLLKAKIKR